MTSTITPGAIPAGAWTIITSGTTANIDITSIPTGYKLLRLVACYDTATGAEALLTFNADTGNNYFFTNPDGTQHGVAYIELEYANTAHRAYLTIDIMNIATLRKEVVGVVSRYIGGVTDNVTGATCGTWTNNTDEINRITITAVTAAVTPRFWVLMGAAWI